MQKEEVTHSVVTILLAVLIIASLFLLLGTFLTPTNWFKGSRDAHRVENLQNLVEATNLYLADNGNFNQLVTGQAYNSLSGNKIINGSGWLPLNFQAISSGAPIASLPLDPTNNSTYNYRFGVNAKDKTFEIDCVLEDGDNQTKQLTDNGNNPARYEVGTDLTILK